MCMFQEEEKERTATNAVAEERECCREGAVEVADDGVRECERAGRKRVRAKRVEQAVRCTVGAHTCCRCAVTMTTTVVCFGVCERERERNNNEGKKGKGRNRNANQCSRCVQSGQEGR